MSRGKQDPEDRALTIQQERILEQAERDMVRGREAQALIENPTLIGALDRIEQTWQEAWRSTAPADVEKREHAYRILLALEEFRSELRSVLESGTFAAKTADTIQDESNLGGREPDRDTGAE